MFVVLDPLNQNAHQCIDGYISCVLVVVMVRDALLSTCHLVSTVLGSCVSLGGKKRP